MRISFGMAMTTLAIAVIAPAFPVEAQASATQWTDWGGGYRRGPDSASTTIATSGAGTAKPAPVAIPPAAAAANVPMTDWGGGYLRGPDSASTTVATSGAGTPKPNN